jgi:biopolymer transport protein ExbB
MIMRIWIGRRMVKHAAPLAVAGMLLTAGSAFGQGDTSKTQPGEPQTVPAPAAQMAPAGAAPTQPADAPPPPEAVATQSPGAAAPPPAVAPPAVTPAAGVQSSLLPADLSLGAMFRNADIVVQAVLVGLILASIVTWTVFLAKGISFLAAMRSVRRSLHDAEEERLLAGLQMRLQANRAGKIQLGMVSAASKEIQISPGQDASGIKERVASRLHRLEAAAGRKMAQGTGTLATIGATAPFVGLFGTVWGIMNSFIGISQSQTTNLAVVAPGIAEALLATATGLVAAIPAVVIYNMFARGIGHYRANLGDLSAAILRLVSREIDHRRHARAAAAE